MTTPRALSVTSRTARSIWSKADVSIGSIWRPASVTSGRFFGPSNSFTPKAASSCLICRLTAPWVTFSSSAAANMRPSRPAASKARRAFRDAMLVRLISEKISQ